MELRDQFAAVALHALMRNGLSETAQKDPHLDVRRTYAFMAYQQADAMMFYRELQLPNRDQCPTCQGKGAIPKETQLRVNPSS